MRNINPRLLVLVTIVSAAAFSRVVPHMPNFSPINAVALFAAAHFSGRAQAYALPLAAVFLSDMFLNNVTYATPSQGFVWFYQGFIWQYLAYAAVTFLGRYAFRKGVNLARTAGATLAAGLVFFTVSNFGVWAASGLYPHSAAGLAACFAAALPFYQGTVTGDVVFSLLLFGTFHLAQKQFAVLEPAAQHR